MQEHSTASHHPFLLDCDVQYNWEKKMWRLALWVFLFCVLLAGTLLAQEVPAKTGPVSISNKDVVEMLKAGLTPEIVIAKIESSKCDFDTSPATLKDLKTSNVPDAVILAMVKASPKTPTTDSAVSDQKPPVTENRTDDRKQEALQKATDDLEDCRTGSQNRYEAKMNAIGTMALTPTTRVVASNKLKQNLDAELRQCRSQYESRLNAINAK